MFAINQDTTWKDLFDAFSADEQSCIRNILGDEQLEAVLGLRLMSQATSAQLDAGLQDCLAPETAAGIILSAFIGQMAGLPPEAEACMRGLIADADAAVIAAGTRPGADPAAANAAFEFIFGLLVCAPGQGPPGSAGPPSGTPQADGPQLWRYGTGGWVVNAPTIVNGAIYVGSDDHYVYSLDAQTGALRWRFETGDIVRSSPTVTGGAVYVGSNDNHVYALNAGTGALMWKHDTGGWVQYSPVVNGGRVYLGAQSDGDYKVHALDALSGAQVWVAEMPYPAGSEFTVTIADGKLYARGAFGEFHALDAATGELVWSYGAAGMGAESPPAISGGVVYMTAVNAAYALDEATGAQLWSFGTERFPARDFPAVVSEGSYYFSPDNHIYALDVATGEPRWSYVADTMIATVPVIAEGMVYVSSESGWFYALDAATGSLIWSRESVAPGLRAPMVVDGVLYAESGDGYLRALRAATGEEIWQFQKGYFDGVPSYTVINGIVYVGSLGGEVYAFTAPGGTPTGEKVLTLHYWQAPSLPGPYLSPGFKDRDAGAVTLEPLAKYDPDGNIVPALAAQIPTLENGGFSHDLRSITWKLQEGLKWSDGSDVTAHDVVFTWRYCVDEDTGCTSESAFDGIASIQAIDNLTVKITFDAPTPYPYNAFVGTGTPIISSAQFAGCIGAAARSCTAQNMTPLGTGPYRIIGFWANQEAVYERNPFYRGSTPYFDRVVLKGGGDATSAARAVLEGGEVDYASNLQIEPVTLARMEAAGRGKVVVAFTSLPERIIVNQTNPAPVLGGNRSEYLGGQNPHPFLSFKPIRQAMSMAINRSIISDQLYGFAARPTCNIVTGPQNYASTANDGCLSQDIAGANRLLDGNGVRDTNGDGIREYNGVPLRIVYQTSTNSVRQATQTLIRDWWRQIGIETELVHHDASLFFGDDPGDASLRRFFADVQMFASGSGIDPQQALSHALCKHIPTRENNWASFNTARSCNPLYDALFPQLEQTQAGPGRDALVKQLNDIYVQSYYEIPLVDRGTVSAHLNTLRGVRINGWDSELWNIAEWRR